MLLFLWRRKGRAVFDFGVPGKIAMFLQGLGFLWLMLKWPFPGLVVGLVATLGTLVGLRQVWKVVRNF